MSCCSRAPKGSRLWSSSCPVRARSPPISWPRTARWPLDVETYFELVFEDAWRDSIPAAIGALAAVGGRVKLRCGGAFVPSLEQVGLVVACCRDAGVAFKATAGLHHPVRRGDEDGSALELEESAREVFMSFGSCSWREPVDGLRELGMVE